MDGYLFPAMKCIFKMDFNPLYQNFAMASSIRVSFIIFAVVYEWLSVLLPDKSRNMSSHCHLTLQFDLTLQDTHLHSLKRLFRALLLETEVWKSILTANLISWQEFLNGFSLRKLFYPWFELNQNHLFITHKFRTQIKN